jgi:hypothetical protein
LKRSYVMIFMRGISNASDAARAFREAMRR